MSTPLPPYQYRPLEDSRTIRILHLHPAQTQDADLKAHLKHANRERLLAGDGDPEFYEAVSYCWGDPTPTHQLIIDNAYGLPITRNVNVLLRHLRSSRKMRYLWVDALCLDQRNDGEKQVQVQLMGGIYAQSVKIHAWICSAEELQNAGALFNVLKWMATCLKTNGSSEVSETRDMLDSICGTDWEHCVGQFYSQPYFQRRWILQELALGHHITVHCGPYKLSWQWFIEGTRGLQRAIDQGLPFQNRKVGAAITTILSIQESSSHKLLSLLWKFHESKCSESQDRIFALYGLAQDSKDLAQVNYSAGWSDTFTRVAGHYFQEEKKTIWLHLAHFGTLSGKGPDGLPYPSWVPNWNNNRHSALIMPDKNTTLLSLNNFGESSFFYNSTLQTVDFDGHYGGRVETVSNGAASANVAWHEGKIAALSEVLLSFFQRAYGIPTTRFEEVLLRLDVSIQGSRYLREALLSVLATVGPWNPPRTGASKHDLHDAVTTILEEIWRSYDIVEMEGKRDAIGVCIRGVQVGDVLVVPSQGPANSIYWPYKGRPLFGVIVRPGAEPGMQSIHTKGQFPQTKTLRGCRYVGLCCFALWEQARYEKLDRVSVQLV